VDTTRTDVVCSGRSSVQDTTVPYPTGAIDADDHFVYDTAGKMTDDVIIETDTDHLITRWYTVPKDQTDDCPPPTYRELFDVEKNIPVSVPINASHENFVVRIEPVPVDNKFWGNGYDDKSRRWSAPPVEDTEHIPMSLTPKCASFKLDNRHFAVSMMRLIIANKTKRATPSVLPPFLKFKRPYNWVSGAQAASAERCTRAC
jgi:hypothetical protein